MYEISVDSSSAESLNPHVLRRPLAEVGLRPRTSQALLYAAPLSQRITPDSVAAGTPTTMDGRDTGDLELLPLLGDDEAVDRERRVRGEGLSATRANRVEQERVEDQDSAEQEHVEDKDRAKRRVTHEDKSIRQPSTPRRLEEGWLRADE
jgi:hypothetical protein